MLAELRLRLQLIAVGRDREPELLKPVIEGDESDRASRLALGHVLLEQGHVCHVGLGVALALDTLRRSRRARDAATQRRIALDDDVARCAMEPLGLIAELQFATQDLVGRVAWSFAGLRIRRIRLGASNVAW